MRIKWCRIYASVPILTILLDLYENCYHWAACREVLDLMLLNDSVFLSQRMLEKLKATQRVRAKWSVNRVHLRPEWQHLMPWARPAGLGQPAETALHKACSKEGIKSQHTLSPCWTCNHGNHSLPLEAFSWVLAQQPRSCNPPLDSPALRQSCSGRASAEPALTSQRQCWEESGICGKSVWGQQERAEKRLRKTKSATLLGFPLSIRPCGSEGGGTQLPQQRLTSASKTFSEDI